MRKTKVIRVRVSDDLAERFAAHAERLETTMSALLVEMMEKAAGRPPARELEIRTPARRLNIVDG